MRWLALLAAAVTLAGPLHAEQAVADSKPRRDPYPWLGRTPPRQPVYPDCLIGPRELAKLPARERPLALDLRPAEDFARGHLPGARPIDLHAPLAAAIAAGEAAPLVAWLRAQGIGPETRVLLYADDLGLPAIGQAFWALEWAGSAMPRVLAGGIEAWLREGGALETGAAAAAIPAGGPPQPRPGLGLAPRTLLPQLGDVHAVEVLDLRGEVAWAGPAGHIPHALAADLPLLLGATEGWPDPEAARAAFAQLGPRKRDYVDLDATFVLAGADAADPAPGLGYLLLRLIDVKAAVQLGGWAAWRADTTLPTTRILDTEAMRAILIEGNPELADRLHPRLPFFDLRGHRDFTREHLPGAVALPAHVVDDSLAALIAVHWPQADPAVDSLAFYCYGADCVRSRIAATKAARLGWRRTLIYQAGVPGWRRAELPLPGRGPQPRVPIAPRQGR